MQQLSLLDLTPVQVPEPVRPPHTCHVPGCDLVIPAKMLMCREHWSRVPKSLQRAVWAYYRPGQETTKNPSAAYLHAAQAAIAAVVNASVLVPEEKRGEFTVGDVVVICPRIPGPSVIAGEIVEVVGRRLPEGMWAIDIGIPSNPYICSEERLVLWGGCVALWRRFDRWSYTGCMAASPQVKTDKPWTNTCWFPASYDPNAVRFQPWG